MVTVDETTRRSRERPDLPWDPAEVAWTHERPTACRAPLPRPGDRGWFRPVAWGDLVPAVVTDVQDLDSDEARRDNNVHRVVASHDTGGSTLHYDDRFDVQREAPHLITPFGHLYDHKGQRATVLRDDPWPIVWLADPTIGRPLGQCREARLRGAPGWWPADHDQRERPWWDGPRLVLPGQEAPA